MAGYSRNASQGPIQGFKLGGAHLKKLGRKFMGYFVCKITILRQKILFFSNFRGTRAGCDSPLDPPLRREHSIRILRLYE